ncbi:MAG: hypothetical protein J0L97_07775 [Alphaproteobacteria bacterium]|nr:hypothetical protein [Alphaproteobacteria bacterium]
MQLYNREYSFQILQQYPEAFRRAFEICFGEALPAEMVGTAELNAWLREHVQDNEAYLLLQAYVRMADFELKTGIRLDSSAFLHNGDTNLPATPESLKEAGQGELRTQSRWMNAAFRSDCRDQLRALLLASQEDREALIRSLPHQEEKWSMIVAFIAYAHNAPWDELMQTEIAYYYTQMASFERSAGNTEVPPDRRIMTNTSLHSLKMYIAADELEQIALNLAETYFPHDAALQFRISECCQTLKAWYIWHDASDYHGEAIFAQVSRTAVENVIARLEGKPEELALLNPGAADLNLSVAGNRSLISKDRAVTAMVMDEYDRLVKIREHEIFEEGLAETLATIRTRFGHVIKETHLEELGQTIRRTFQDIEHDEGIMHARLKLFDHLQTTYDILNANRNGQKKYSPDEREAFDFVDWHSFQNGRSAFKVDYVMRFFLQTREFALQSGDPLDWILDEATAQLVEQHYRIVMRYLPEKFEVEPKYRGSILVTEKDDDGRNYTHARVFSSLLRAVLGGHIHAVDPVAEADNPLRFLETSPLRAGLSR